MAYFIRKIKLKLSILRITVKFNRSIANCLSNRWASSQTSLHHIVTQLNKHFKNNDVCTGTLYTAYKELALISDAAWTTVWRRATIITDCRRNSGSLPWSGVAWKPHWKLAIANRSITKAGPECFSELILFFRNVRSRYHKNRLCNPFQRHSKLLVYVIR